jgi:hypothetical protein
MKTRKISKIIHHIFIVVAILMATSVPIDETSLSEMFRWAFFILASIFIVYLTRPKRNLNGKLIN